jgi:4-hydroxy-tetrahydrodipicolinate synthase
MILKLRSKLVSDRSRPIQPMENQMNVKPIAGVYAALLTPRGADNSIDLQALKNLVQFLMSHGITAYAINGATGEFCLTTPSELQAILTTVRQVTNGRAEILCGVGAAGTQLAVELAAVAQAEAVMGLLLPMPYFFPYRQEDLDLFCRTVAASTSLPILLYNLPQFTTGLEKETVLTLVQDVPNILGIKDSSGSLEILSYLTQHAPDACRMVGNDSALAPALVQGLCDGVVSGVACVLPEAILALYHKRHDTSSEDFSKAAHRLDEFIDRLNRFPTPWGLKFLAEARGIFVPTFAQPVTAHRVRQGEALAAWFAAWAPTLVPTVDNSR